MFCPAIISDVWTPGLLGVSSRFVETIRIRESETVSCSVVHGNVKVSVAPLSMGFSRQKYWSGLPCPPSGDLQDPGIEPMSSALLNLELDGFQNNIRSKHSYWDFLVTQW